MLSIWVIQISHSCGYINLVVFNSYIFDRLFAVGNIIRNQECNMCIASSFQFLCHGNPRWLWIWQAVDGLQICSVAPSPSWTDHTSKWILHQSVIHKSCRENASFCYYLFCNKNPCIHRNVQVITKYNNYSNSAKNFWIVYLLEMKVQLSMQRLHRQEFQLKR